MNATQPKRKLTLADLKREAAKHGGTVVDESSGDWAVYQCESPAGKVWSCTGDLHALKVEWLPVEGPSARHEAIVDAIERMAIGVEECENPECDYCHPEE